MATISKAEAKYEPISDVRHCEDCTMFRVPIGAILARCSLVEGVINPQGTCRFFQRKPLL